MVHDIRCGNDDLRIDQFTIKGGVCTIFVGGGDELMALVFQPLSQTKLVLTGSKEFGDIFGVLMTLHNCSAQISELSARDSTYVVKDSKNFNLGIESCC